MAFCGNCGTQLVDGAKFCQKCGAAVKNSNGGLGSQRQQEFVGKIYKCPNCGETLKSFVRNCPTCGLELRGTKATSAVREFALKLEAIESRREYERPRGLFSKAANVDRISKTDEQKISLIQSFSIPNTKEDMLEFMILATSNVNTRLYDFSNTDVSKSERAINDAWMAKIKQVYEKAKLSFGNEEDFIQIEKIFRSCNTDINKAKKKGAIKVIAMAACIPSIIIVIFLVLAILGPGAQRKETARLESIEKVVVESLENGEYKKALLNAEALVYQPEVRNRNADEIERQWNVKRQLYIDEILTEAEKHGVNLESPMVEYNNSIRESVQSKIEAIKEYEDTIKRIMGRE